MTHSALETLNTLIGLDVLLAMRSAIVTAAAKHFFYSKKESFATNPANTLIYSGLNALEERCVVHLAETLKSDLAVPLVPKDFQPRADLVNHRIVLSHPYRVKWKDAGVQQFFNADRHILDIRSALIWDLQRSINDRIRQEGGRTHNDDVQVTYEMALALRDIYLCSLKPIAVQSLSSLLNDPNELLPSLTKFKDRFLSFIVEPRVETERG